MDGVVFSLTPIKTSESVSDLTQSSQIVESAVDYSTSGQWC